MKNRNILFSILLMITGSSFAQETDLWDRREDFTIGGKIGLNFSNVWDEEGQDFRADGKFGLAGELFLAIPLGKYIGIQPEVMLSQKGFRADGTLLGTAYSYTKTSSFIDVPIQFQLKPLPFLSVLAGPQVSFLVHEKNVYTFGTNSTEQEQEFENDNIRKNILGFVVGADVNIYHVVVSARAGWDFQTNKGDGTSTTPRYRNQYLQFTVGFKL
jgi:Outer membrane protein beta-barrel domain